MVSVGVCFDGNERLHFIPDKIKVNAKLYVETLLTEQIQECRSVLPSGFIFQQDGAPVHMTKLVQDWIATNCSEFIGKDEWPPNSHCVTTNRMQKVEDKDHTRLEIDLESWRRYHSRSPSLGRVVLLCFVDKHQ